MRIKLILDDVALCISPAHSSFKQMLCYEYKTLEQVPGRPWQFASRREHRELFREVENDGATALITHHGFWNRVVAFIMRCHWQFDIEDRRIKFPEPQFDLMRGFRFSQEPLLRAFLGAGYSGCLKAPTRYGKTTLLLNTIRAYPDVCTVFTCPGDDLLRQSYQDLKVALPERNIVRIGSGSSARTSSEDLTICSMDSLHLCDHGRVRLLLIDEPHAMMTDGRIEQLHKFQLARRLSFGATLEGRYDQRDLVLEGLLGPVLAQRTYEEAVAEGAICPLVVFMLKVTIPQHASQGNRNQVYKREVYLNQEFAHRIAQICESLPEDWQHLIFIEQEKQAELIKIALGDDTPIIMAKRLPKKKERRDATEDMRYNRTRRAIASDVLSQGVTMHDLRVVINATGGGGAIGAIQKPGRLAETRPGKKAGYFIDFLIDCPTNPKCCLTIDSWARHRVYKNKGYEIHIVESMSELHAKLQDRES